MIAIFKNLKMFPKLCFSSSAVKYLDKHKNCDVTSSGVNVLALFGVHSSGTNLNLSNYEQKRTSNKGCRRNKDK